MSDYEHKKGRLIPMYREDKEDDKTYFKRVQGDRFDEETWDEEDGDIQEYFSMTGSDGFIYNNDLLYKIVDLVELDPYGSVKILRPDSDGYYFEMRYYNGGTCLSEMIESALGNIDEEVVESKWISSDIPPTHGNKVLVKTKDYRRPSENVTDIDLGYFENGEWYWACEDSLINSGHGWYIFEWLEIPQ